MSDQDLTNHARTRKNVLLELKKICSGSNEAFVGPDGSNETQVTLSPIADCLLELNPPELREFAADNFNCYRCKHFLEVPQNFHKSLERISERVERFEDDLKFVQAIVWLRSAVDSRKEIPLDQFRSIFQRQWASVCDEKTPKEDHFELNSEYSYDDLREALTGLTEEFIMQCQRDVSNIELLQDNGSYEAENEICTVAETILSKVVSDLSERRFGFENEPVENRIIPETDDESCSDIFRDSSEEKSRSTKINDTFSKRELLKNDEAGKLLRGRFVDGEDDRSESDIFLDKNDSLNSLPSVRGKAEMGNIVIEDSDSEALTSSYASLTRIHEKVSNLSENYPGDWSFELQSQITNEFTGDRSFVLTCASFRQGLDNRTENIFNLSGLQPEATVNTRKVDDSAYDTLTFTNSSQDPSTKNDNTKDKEFLETDFRLSGSFGPISNIRGKNDRETITTMNSYRNEKKRKLKLSFSFSSGNETKRRKVLSSEWLNFVFDSLNTDEIVLRSMRIILSFFEDERISKDYAKRRRWKNTLEREAVNAILNLCDVFEAEKRTSVYSQEVLQTVTRTLERIIGKAGRIEAAPWTFHVSIILEFCNSMEVCTKVIDHLTEKLQSYERQLVSLLNGGQAEMHRVVNELHVVFYGLTVSLEKYRLFVDNIGEQNFEESIVAVVDLWKKRFTDSELTRKESRKSREQRWMKIFEGFGAFACEDFVQFAEKSRILSVMLSGK